MATDAPPEKHRDAGVDPPDGGARAWLVMLASFMCNGLLFGVINTYSVVYVNLHKKLEEESVSEASSKASLVGSLAIGTTFFLSPVAGILTDKIGIRTTTFIGGLLASGGMLLSSLCTRVEGLYLTYGVLFGMGASLTYTPSLVILGHYFKRYMGIVNGFVTAGSSVFTVIMTFALDGLLKHVALVHCFQVLAALMALIMPCALLFKPLPVSSSQPQRCDNSLASQLKSLVNVDIWKRRKYVIWALVVPLALFGYFVPYVHMVKFVEIKFPESDGKLLVMCIGITSGVGRLIFGKIADIPRVNRIFLQQISFLSIGLLTMLLTVTNSFALLVVIALCMGIFDGCFISLLGPIAFEICGHKGATQAIGFLLGFCSIPLTLGPPIAGLIFDHTNSYYIPFLLAGVPPILGALALFAVCCVSEEDEKKGVSLAMVDASTPLQNGKGPVLDKTREDENKMEETDAPHCNGDVIPSIDEEYQDSEEEQSLMGEVKKISVQSTA